MIRNPFRYSRPVAPAAFVGRWPAVHRLAADLTLEDGDSYALIGGRRCGKSSFLAALAHTLNQPDLAGSGDWRPLPLPIDCAPLTITAPGDFLLKCYWRCAAWSMPGLYVSPPWSGRRLSLSTQRGLPN